MLNDRLQKLNEIFLGFGVRDFGWRLGSKGNRAGTEKTKPEP